MAADSSGRLVQVNRLSFRASSRVSDLSAVKGIASTPFHTNDVSWLKRPTAVSSIRSNGLDGFLSSQLLRGLKGLATASLAVSKKTRTKAPTGSNPHESALNEERPKW